MVEAPGRTGLVGPSPSMTEPIDIRRATPAHPPLWRWDTSQFGGPPRPRVSRPKGVRLWPGWRNWRKPLNCQITYHGGPQGEVWIRARGWDFAFPWHVTVIEALQAVNGHPPKKL